MSKKGRNCLVSLVLVIVFIGPMLFGARPTVAWPFESQIISNDDEWSGSDPAIAVGCDGDSCDTVHVVWVELHRYPRLTPCLSIFYRRSSDGGNSWDFAPRRISNPHVASWWPIHCLDAGRPSIAVLGSEIFVVWPNEFEEYHGAQTPEKYYHIYLQYSSDNGDTWLGQEISIDDSRDCEVPPPWPECSWIVSGLGALSPYVTASVVVTENYVHATWKANYYRETHLYEIRYDRALRSSPLAWDTDQTVADVSTEARSVDIAAQGDDVHVTYIDVGPQAVYYVMSPSSGALSSWNSPEAITPTYVAYPEYPVINVSKCNVHVAWEDQRVSNSYQIYYIMSNDCGSSWIGTGERISGGSVSSSNNNYLPSIASTGATVYVTWTDYNSGDLSIVYDWNLHNGEIGSWGNDIIIYSYTVPIGPIPPHPENPGMSDLSLYGNDMHIVWVDYGATYENSFVVYYSHQLDEMAQAGTLPTTALKGTASVYVFYPHPSPGGYRVFVIGGESSSALSGDVLIYNPASDSFEANPYCTLGGASPGIAYASAIWDGGDHIYVFGGKRPGNIATDKIWAIDLSDPNSIYRCQVTGAILVAPMYGTSAVFDETDHYAWIFGGHDPNVPAYYSFIQRWNLDWMTDAELFPGVMLPTARAFTSAIIEYSGPNPRAFIFGGEKAGAEPLLDEIVRFDTKIRAVVAMQATLPTKRSRTSAAFDDTYAYVFGGEDDNGPLDEIVRFNTNAYWYWDFGAVSICEKLPMKLIDTSATATINAHVTAGGGIRIFGGEGPIDLTDKIERFSPAYWIP